MDEIVVITPGVLIQFLQLALPHKGIEGTARILKNVRVAPEGK